MVTLAVTEQTWAYARVLGDQAVVVVLNNAADPVVLDIPTSSVGGMAGRPVADRLGGTTARIENGRLLVSMSARSAAIYTVR